MKVFSISAFLVLLSCSPAPNESCSTSIVDKPDGLERVEPYRLAIINVESSRGTSWCNASLNLKPLVAGKMRATLTTAKHCINPWTFRNLSVQLAGNNGYFDVDVRSDYLQKLVSLSDAVSGKVEQIKSDNAFDFVTNITPVNPSGVGVIKNLREVYPKGEEIPESLLELNAQLDSEKVNNNGKSLCEIGSNPVDFNNKLCFTVFDMLSFEVEISVPETHRQAMIGSNSSYGDVLTNYEKLSQFEFDMLTSKISERLQKCSTSTESVFCGASGEKLKQLVNVTSGDYKSTAKEYLQTQVTIMEYIRANIRGSDQLRLINNVSLGSDRFLAAKIPLNRSVLSTLTPKLYGFVANARTSALQFAKGDSGSVLTFMDVPIAVLSTYRGDPTTSGPTYVTPSAEEEIVIPQPSPDPIASIPQPPVEKNPTTPRFPTVGPVVDGNAPIDNDEILPPSPIVKDSFDEMFEDLNNGDLYSSTCG